MSADLIRSPWPGRLLRWGLAAVFGYAGVRKLMDPEAFAAVIDAFGLVPGGFVKPLAVGLPFGEVAAAAGLVFERRGALAATAGLLVLFIAILVYALWLGLDVDCGCFGPSDPEYRAFHSLWPALYRDLVMLAAVLLLLVRDLAVGRVASSINAVPQEGGAS
ncbi:MAG: MauE/DoxX family redox-associated membrane protein [Thermodesulfobacteriota bacterium]